MNVVAPLLGFINSCKDITAKDLKDVHTIHTGGATTPKNSVTEVISKAGKNLFFQNVKKHINMAWLTKIK